MVDIEIDVYRAGQLVGSGPIYKVTVLPQGDRVNESGNWSFSGAMQAGDATQFLIEDSEVFGHLIGPVGRLPLFGGRIDTIDKTAAGDGMVKVSCSGNGLLSELAYNHISELKLSEPIPARPPGDARTLTGDGELSVPEWSDGDPNTSAEATLSKIDWIYVYDTSKFNEVILNVTVPNSEVSYVQAQIYTQNRPEGKGRGWEEVTPVLNEWGGAGGVWFDSVGRKRFAFTVDVSWDEVILNQLQGYLFRFRPTEKTIDFTLSGIEIVVRGPNRTDDFKQVIDQSDRFSMADGSLIASANGYYGDLGDMSVLAAARRVVEGSNDVFRLKAANLREIELIRGDTPVESGLRAAGPLAVASLGDLEANQLALTHLKKKQDFRKKINKLFVFGNGSGKGSQFTLSSHTLVSGVDYSADFVIDRNESSITYLPGYALAPAEASKRFGDIKTLDGKMQGPEVSNQLARLALAELSQRISGVAHYSGSVAGFRSKLLWPGDGLTVDYGEYAGGVELLKVDGFFMVTEASYQLNGGLLEADLTVSSVPRPPVREQDVFLDRLEQARRAETNEQRLRGLAVYGVRVPELGSTSAVAFDELQRQPYAGANLPVPAWIFDNDFEPTDAEFQAWFSRFDAGEGVRYEYAHAGINGGEGDENAPSWTWVSNGDGTANLVQGEVI